MLSANPENLSLSRYEFAEQCLRDHITEFSGDIFDVGSGDGRMQSVVKDMGLSWRGFDLVPSSLEIEKWDFNSPQRSLPQGAAMVLMLDVLEHLSNPALGLKHVAEMIVPGGLLLLTMPNPRWSTSRIEALINGCPTCFTQADLDDNGHIFTTWPHVVEKLLGDTGFEVRQYVTLDGPTRWPGKPITMHYPLRIIRAITNKLIELCDPTARGMSYALLAQLRK